MEMAGGDDGTAGAQVGSPLAIPFIFLGLGFGVFIRIKKFVSFLFLFY
jgi:hypothetical protein